MRDRQLTRRGIRSIGALALGGALTTLALASPSTLTPVDTGLTIEINPTPIGASEAFNIVIANGEEGAIPVLAIGFMAAEFPVPSLGLSLDLIPAAHTFLSPFDASGSVTFPCEGPEDPCLYAGIDIFFQVVSLGEDTCKSNLLEVVFDCDPCVDSDGDQDTDNDGDADTDGDDDDSDDDSDKDKDGDADTDGDDDDADDDNDGDNDLDNDGDADTDGDDNDKDDDSDSDHDGDADTDGDDDDTDDDADSDGYSTTGGDADDDNDKDKDGDNDCDGDDNDADDDSDSDGH